MWAFVDHKDLGNHLLQLCPIHQIPFIFYIHYIKNIKPLKPAMHLGSVSNWTPCIWLVSEKGLGRRPEGLLPTLKLWYFQDTHTHTHARARAPTCVCANAHTQTSCTCTHTNTCMHVRTHVHTRTHIHPHHTHTLTTHTHTHTHTHTRNHGNDAVKNLYGGEHLGKAPVQYI